MLRTLFGALALALACIGPAAALPPPSPALRYFSEPPSLSGAATFNLGDRFLGPGFVTVGWAGSKKQVILPGGEWVVLAVADHTNGSASVKFATVVFGKFSGDRLASSLTVTVNRYATPVTRWSDIEACAVRDPTQLHLDAGAMSAVSVECARIHGVAAAIPSNGPYADELRQSLKRLGARAGGTALVSQMYFAGKPHGYMRIVRTDWPGVALGPSDAADWRPEALAASEDRRAYVDALVRWVQAYRPFAAQGFRRAFDDDDLAPGSRFAGPAHLSAVTDFEPPARAAR